MKHNIELLFREGMDAKLQEITEKNPAAKFYSYSRLENYHTCHRQYYYTYIDKKPQKAGIYGILGTALHSDQEDLYEGRTEVLTPKHFNDEWTKCELFGIDFPQSKYDIKGNYRKDIETCYKYNKKIETDGEFISELGFILQVDDNNYIMGYIDLIELLPNNRANIYDFKTSAMFKDEKLIKAGRQLILYALAIEQLYSIPVDKVAWMMVKYVEVQVGANKPRIFSGREWFSKSQSQIKTLMKKHGMDDNIISMMLAMCENTNDIDILPAEIKEHIKVNIHIKDYPITTEMKEETLQYMRDTIAAIESMDKEDINKWEKHPNQFFCTNLCGFFPKHCNGDCTII